MSYTHGMASVTPAAYVPIDPRAAASLVLWGIRYASPRLLTGAATYPQRAASVLAPYLANDERQAISDAANEGLSLAQRAIDPDLGPPGLSCQEAIDRAESWQSLIAKLDASNGDVHEGPVLEWWGDRTLALTSLSAVRFLSDRALFDKLSSKEKGAVASVSAACGACADEYSPSDRVLIMRDLASAAEASARVGEDFQREWCDLYAHLASMPLDEEYRLLNHLPDSIG